MKKKIKKYKDIDDFISEKINNLTMFSRYIFITAISESTLCMIYFYCYIRNINNMGHLFNITAGICTSVLVTLYLEQLYIK